MKPKVDGESPSNAEADGTLAERVSNILDAISAEASAGDTAGRLTENSIDALSSCGLFRLQAPKCFGGLEAGALEALRIFEMVSEADGSAGWVLMACNLASGSAAAYLPDGGAKAIFKDHVPIIAGHGVPRGRAIVDGDGYRLTGTWSYGSGLLHAEHIHTGGMILNEDGSPREARIFIVPAKHATILGNWDVVGLRATGSVDYSLENVYVPEELTHLPSTLNPLRGSEVYRIGLVGLAPLGHGAFALGVGRRILTELAMLASSSGGRPSALSDGVGEIFQEGYGVAEGKMRAGRAFFYEIYGEVDDVIAKGDPITMRHFSLMRLALNNATAAAADVAAFAYRVGGGATLRQGTLQQCIRNMMAGKQHRIVSSFILRECARELLGLANGKIWTSAGLVDPPLGWPY